MYKSTPVVSDAELNGRSAAVPNTFSVSASEIRYHNLCIWFGT